MPRDDITLAGLQDLLDKLPGLEEVFFEANLQLKSVKIHFGDGAYYTFSKNGYSKGHYSKIYYGITVVHQDRGISTQLTTYVAPSAQSSANREAVASAIRYFQLTEGTVMTRDVEACAFEAPQ
ncbi:hypothetical protein GY45DRAFT_462686 [Cubamyces sp. BRFM 1775]|nr:hypothetical protein GY45DRAFT_462686 [Cubamyces sp. BRFM 1775]